MSGGIKSALNLDPTALDPVQARVATPITSPSSPAEEAGTLKVLQREFESHLGYHHRDIAQLGRAPSLGGGCRRFESCYPDHAGLAQ